jgi:transcriptional regulator with XRE-family HTH domain
MGEWVRYGEQIRKVRKAFGLTQEEFSKKAGIAVNSLRRYEANERQPTIEIATQMAQALGLSLREFLSHDPVEKRSYFWVADLEDRLKQMGYSIGHDEDEGALWLNYPDGSTLGITEDDLNALADNSDAYLRFLLEDLRKRLSEYLTPASPTKQDRDD